MISIESWWPEKNTSELEDLARFNRAEATFRRISPRRRAKLSETKKNVAPKIRALGFTYEEVAKILGTTMQAAYYHSNPEQKTHYRDYVRLSRLVITVDGKKKLLSNLHKRAIPETCELCNKPFGKRAHYHHWDNEFPDIGIWVCVPCHRGVEFIEKHKNGTSLQSVIDKYYSLKKKAEREWVGAAMKRVEAQDEKIRKTYEKETEVEGKKAFRQKRALEEKLGVK